MKKILLFILLSVIGINTTHALDLDITKTTISGYDYTINGENYSLTLLNEKKNGLPVFQIEGNKKFVNTSNYLQRTQDYKYKEEILNLCYLSTKGEKVSNDNLLNRIAVSFYLFELDAKENNYTINYSFDTSEIKQIASNLLNEATTMLNKKTYDYEGYTDEWTPLENFPWRWSSSLEEISGLEIDYNQSDYVVKASKSGDYTFKAYVFNNTPVYSYYVPQDNTKPTYLSVSVPQRQLPIINVHVKDKTNKITVLDGEGYTVDVASDKVAGEEVKLNINYLDGYELDNILATSNGHIVTVTNNSFIMPDNDVTILITAKKITYNIKTQINNVNSDTTSSATYGDTVNILVTPIENYTLDSLVVKTISGKELPVTNNTFIMPNEDVYITGVTTKSIHKLNLELDEGVTLNLNKEYVVGSIIDISYELDNDYAFNGINLTTKSGKTINITDKKFIMPNEDVTLKINTLKIIKYPINVIHDETVKPSIKSVGASNEMIFINYTLNDGYEIKNIIVKTESGKSILVKKDSFIMPNESVDITIETNKAKKDFIVNLWDGVKLKNNLKDSYYPNSLIDFSYEISFGYKLEKIYLQNESGEELTYQNNEFIMPNENVSLTITTNKKHNINVIKDDNLDVKVVDSAYNNEIVLLDVLPNNNDYEIDNYTVNDSKGGIIGTNISMFIMPDEDVTIKVHSRKKENYFIRLTTTKGVKLDIPSLVHHENDIVTFKPIIEEGYTLENFKINTDYNYDSKTNTYMFTMPNHHVEIYIGAKKAIEKVDIELDELNIIEYEDDEIKEEEIKEDYYYFDDIPNTYESGINTIILSLFFIINFGLYVKKTLFN